MGKISISVAMISVLCVLHGLPPYETLVPFWIHEPAVPVGALGRDNLLDSAKVIFPGSIRGPESIVEVEDPRDGISDIYTGVRGAILKVTGGGTRYEIVASTGNCEHNWDAENCGRPLGLRADKKGNILIADAYKGILRLDPRSGNLTTLINASHPIDGWLPGIPNSVDISSDQHIYWTDSSRYKLHMGIADMLGSATGRLIRYDPRNGENTVLMNDLHFANGVQLSPGEDFVVVAECFRLRLTRYWLKGSNAGKREVFSLLPGTPDNLKLAPNGNMLVGIVIPRFTDTTFFLTDFGSLTPRPWLRYFIIRLLSSFKLAVDTATQIIPAQWNTVFRWLSYKILSLEEAALVLGKYGLVLEVDWKGTIVRSWHNPSGTTPGISEAYITKDGAMWLASLNHYLARVPPESVSEAIPRV